MGLWGKKRKKKEEPFQEEIKSQEEKKITPKKVDDYYSKNTEKLRVKYGKEKRLWDIINIVLVMIIFIWLLLFAIYYFQGKIEWLDTY